MDAGVTTIKAIAKKGGVTTTTPVTYNVVFQTTTDATDANKRPYLIWNKNNNSNWMNEDSSPKPTFFMIPADEADGDVTVNTTTMPRPTMEWLFFPSWCPPCIPPD